MVVGCGHLAVAVVVVSGEKFHGNAFAHEKR